MTQTNQLLKGVKGEFSALGNKHTCRLLFLAVSGYACQSQRCHFLIARLLSRGSLLSGPSACRTVLVPGLPTVTTTYYSLSD